MAKQSATKIAEYVEAQRDLDAMKAQVAEDKTRADDPVWAKMFRDAKGLAATLYRDLKGGELGKANRILTEGRPHGQ